MTNRIEQERELRETRQAVFGDDDDDDLLLSESEDHESLIDEEEEEDKDKDVMIDTHVALEEEEEEEKDPRSESEESNDHYTMIHIPKSQTAQKRRQDKTTPKKGVKRMKSVTVQEPKKRQNEEQIQAALAEFDAVVNRRKSNRPRPTESNRGTTEETEHLDEESSWDDRMQFMIQEMLKMAEKDQQLNKANVPATEKIKILPIVMKDLSIPRLFEQWLENGVLTAIRAWLEPLEDASLPSLNVRRAMFDLLAQMPMTKEYLRNSGIGKIISFYQKVDRELPDIRRQADMLIHKWGRLFVNRSTDYTKRKEQSAADAREKMLATDRNIRQIVAAASGVQSDFWTPQPRVQEPLQYNANTRINMPPPMSHTYDLQPKDRVKHAGQRQKVPHIPKKLAATMNKMRQGKKNR